MKGVCEYNFSLKYIENASLTNLSGEFPIKHKREIEVLPFQRQELDTTTIARAAIVCRVAIPGDETTSKGERESEHVVCSKIIYPLLSYIYIYLVLKKCYILSLHLPVMHFLSYFFSNLLK